MQSDTAAAIPAEVKCVRDVALPDLLTLLTRYGLQIITVPDAQPIPGSYWGDREAGLLQSTLYFRRDTPLQSVLHEACHFICMDSARRDALNKDAGGDFDEENAVCYLQILLADQVPGFGRERMLMDMDAWGYTFRLGSARAWFEQDGQDAKLWLMARQLITDELHPGWQLRD